MTYIFLISFQYYDDKIESIVFTNYDEAKKCWNDNREFVHRGIVKSMMLRKYEQKGKAYQYDLDSYKNKERK